MNVYEVTASAKPPNSEFDHYAPLVTNSRRTAPHFSGRPLKQKWKPIRLEVSMPLLPRAAFSDFGTGVFVCNARAAQLAAEPLEMCGELLRAKVEGESGQFFLYNVTNCISAI